MKKTVSIFGALFLGVSAMATSAQATGAEINRQLDAIERLVERKPAEAIRLLEEFEKDYGNLADLNQKYENIKTKVKNALNVIEEKFPNPTMVGIKFAVITNSQTGKYESLKGKKINKSTLSFLNINPNEPLLAQLEEGLQKALELDEIDPSFNIDFKDKMKINYLQLKGCRTSQERLSDEKKINHGEKDSLIDIDIPGMAGCNRSLISIKIE